VPRRSYVTQANSRERTLFLSWPFFALILFILEHPGKENIQLDLLAFLGISFVGLRKGDVRVNGENCYTYTKSLVCKNPQNLRVSILCLYY
jgi:hypothetical protein